MIYARFWQIKDVETNSGYDVILMVYANKLEVEKHDVTKKRAEAAKNRAEGLESDLREEKKTTADLRTELLSRNQDLRKKDEDFKKCEACPCLCPF